jgi:hypothetical protein
MIHRDRRRAVVVCSGVDRRMRLPFEVPAAAIGALRRVVRGDETSDIPLAFPGPRP